jgi:hypothetical protein
MMKEGERGHAIGIARPLMSRRVFLSRARLSVCVQLSAFCFLFAGILSCGFVQPSWSQQPPPPAQGPPPVRPGPPKLDGTAVLEHMEKVRRQLDEVKPGGPEVEVLVRAAHRTLDIASEKAKAKDYFGADRRIAAADAFRRAAEHPTHVTEGPKGPVPQAREIADHLQRVYFRLQQAEYFADASGDPDAKSLPGAARRFYEDARKAYDTGNWFTADEFAKSADDTIHGLENLAQAAAPAPPPPPGRP